MQIKPIIYKILAAVIVGGSFLVAKTVKADESVATQLQAGYVFAASDSAKVTLDYRLTNKSATAFVESYQLKIPENGVTSLVLQQKEQQIDKTSTLEGGFNIFELKFLNQVVGQGKSREFSLEYSDSSLMTVRGKNIVIRLPIVGEGTTYQKYQTKVTVPTSFGEPSTISPAPTSKTNRAGQIIYTFALATPTEIVIKYGETQIFQFSWEKELRNQSNTTTYKQLNLPVDNEKETFLYAFLTPTPTLSQIKNSQWQLFYLLKPQEKIQVQASGYLTAKNVDETYVIENSLPADLKNDWRGFFVDSIPEEVMTKVKEATPEMKVKLAKWWFLPLPGLLTVDVYNQNGQMINAWQLTATTTSDLVTTKIKEASVQLLPWQKSTYHLQLKNRQWWPLYQETKVLVTLMNNQGQIIRETEYEGLALAYPTLAISGGILAAAITAGSLLVARKK